jgi:hypothetical protein
MLSRFRDSVSPTHPSAVGASPIRLPRSGKHQDGIEPPHALDDVPPERHAVFFAALHALRLTMQAPASISTPPSTSPVPMQSRLCPFDLGRRGAARYTCATPGLSVQSVSWGRTLVRARLEMDPRKSSDGGEMIRSDQNGSNVRSCTNGLKAGLVLREFCAAAARLAATS